MSQYILVSRSAEYEGRLQELLGVRLTAIESAHLADGPQAVFARSPRRPTVALLGPLLTYEETKSLGDGLIERFPEIGIVVVRDGRGDLEDWIDGMRIHAVLAPDADDATVEGLLQRLDERVQQLEDGVPEIRVSLADDAAAPVPPAPVEIDETEVSRVISVVAPKGGQGKTTVAINLATGLAEVAPNSVVLVDADLQFGDIANSLDLPLRRTLEELINRDVVTVKTTLMHHSDDFFVIPSPRSPEDADIVDPPALAALLRQLSEIFRYVIVDTTPGLGEHTLAVLESSTDVLFVSALTVPSLRALHAELKTLEKIDLLPHDRRMVLNFADRNGGLKVSDAATITGVPVDIVIPRSKSAVLAANRGVPLIHHDVRDPAAKALRELVVAYEPSALPTRRRIHRRTA
ncbi:MAG: AAA family ATPase [Pseudolysinimonas sp.]|jgi:Flp pilus assembly CpaE family ATPase|uniref:AAA family ATPase n=1 Tax=Pseudolysinimonas sp. TaxID=2680009 RepID=UPI003C773177